METKYITDYDHEDGRIVVLLEVARFDKADEALDFIKNNPISGRENSASRNKALREALNTLIDPVTKDFYVEYKVVIPAIDRKKILKALQSKQG